MLYCQMTESKIFTIFGRWRVQKCVKKGFDEVGVESYVIQGGCASSDEFAILGLGLTKSEDLDGSWLCDCSLEPT